MNFIEFSEGESAAFGDLEEYIFDWTKRSGENTIVVGSIHDGDIAGLVEYERQPSNQANYMWLLEVSSGYRGSAVAGELLAYVGRDSMEQGYEGFFFFEPKTSLYLFYQVKYGAKPSHGRYLYFDGEATRNLIVTYLGDSEE
ncbi:MAG: hypothetical protein LBB58_00705 [Cellulomonadaceae bacterium]|jgi:hypothetical protein|nr:hypothetical protein [Cellulomonadaceae bacterium]